MGNKITIKLLFFDGGDILIKEVMNEIGKAEQQAEQTVGDAMFQANHMIEAAKKNAAEHKEREIKNQEVLAKKKLEEAKRQGEVYSAQVEDETIKERQNILKKAKDNEEGAIELVINSLIS